MCEGVSEIFSVIFFSAWKTTGNKACIFLSYQLAPCDCDCTTVGCCLLPVCQRPTGLVHFDIHMGAVMILKAAIKLTVAFRGSAWCRHCAAPIILSGITPCITSFFFPPCFFFSVYTSLLLPFKIIWMGQIIHIRNLREPIAFPVVIRINCTSPSLVLERKK